MASARVSYCCEICGLESLDEEAFRLHTHTAHVAGHGECPFCQLGSVSPSELLLHVNQAHLDFLTPESELNMSFIDDISPGFNEYNNGGECSSQHCWNGMKSNGSSDAGIPNNINNINLTTPKHNLVNGGGALSPKTSTHGHGSPLRSTLNLQLAHSVHPPSPSPRLLECPLCHHHSTDATSLEAHINRQHFDLTSPSVVSASATNHTTSTMETFPCPICGRCFNAAADLELHVNIEHRDVLSPVNAATTTAVANSKPDGRYSCPVCGITLDDNSEAASRHVESHFPTASPPPLDREALRRREARDFELLRAQYGMDEQGNFRDQSAANMQRAVYAGEMSVADYYERTLDLRAAESCGVDDGSSVTRSIVPRVRAMSTTSLRTLTCTCVDHYASSYGDRGWGCGYRNTQMMIASLLNHTGYNEKLYKIWMDQKPPRSSVPSISRLQQLIEQAWGQGFDIQGSEQLGSKLVNTRKWIGATEVVTLLSFLRIRCQLIDFHRPTGAAGTHPKLFQWVLKYFDRGSPSFASASGGGSTNGDFVPPLYLQHQGHSRTIMGIEVQKDGTLVLLVLDPSHSPQQMAQFGETSASAANAALRLLRKSEASMKARQYQIVAVVGTLDTEEQYQQSKILRGVRIPQDR